MVGGWGNVLGLACLVGLGCSFKRPHDVLPDLEPGPCEPCKDSVSVRAWLPVVGEAPERIELGICYDDECWAPESLQTNRARLQANDAFPFWVNTAILAAAEADVDPGCSAKTQVLLIEVQSGYSPTFESSAVAESLQLTVTASERSLGWPLVKPPRGSLLQGCEESGCPATEFDYLFECPE